MEIEIKACHINNIKDINIQELEEEQLEELEVIINNSMSINHMNRIAKVLKVVLAHLEGSITMNIHLAYQL